MGMIENTDAEIDTLDVTDEIEDDLIVESEEYTPDFNYKVKDEEKQFDERFHDLVKSKEDEDWIRDLHTRADGMGHIKETLGTTQGELEEYRQGFNNLYGGFEKIKLQRDSGDLRPLMKTLGVTDDQLLEYAIKLAEEENLPDEQREAVRVNRESNDRISQLEKQISGYQSESSAALEQREMAELDSLVANPEYSPVFEVLKNGGRDVVSALKQHGNAMYRTTEQYPSVSQVVDSFVKENSFLLNLAPRQEQAGMQTLNRQPTLPKVRASGSAPVEQGINSIEDLYKLRNAMNK